MQQNTSTMQDLKILEKIGSGSFGEVFDALLNGNIPVAIKIERKHNNMLRHEHLIYKKLIKSACKYLPRIYSFGPLLYKNEEVDVLVMEKLGPSLESRFVECGKAFSLKTTLMLADLMLSRIEYLHHMNYVHRDIKPDNFLFGMHNNFTLYLIDFGLAKQYRHSLNHEHIPHKSEKSFLGTTRFCSINTHLGIEQSRRDDLESLVYCLIYFMKGKLPWQGMVAKNRNEKFLKILQCKQETTLHELCEGLPGFLINFTIHVRGLDFAGIPNYCYLRKLIKDAIKDNRIEYNYEFDWATKKGDV